MTSQQRILVVVVFVVALLGGGFLALTILGGGPGGTTSTPSAVALVTASPGAAGSPEGSGTPSGSAPATEPPASSTPAAPTPTPTRKPSATPRPPNGPGQPATMLFTSLKLDATDDPAGTDRTITFQSQGTGAITVGLTTMSPQGTTIMCLSADGKRLGCRTSAEGALNANTTKRSANFTLTLRGQGIDTPIVEVTLTFPARDPSVTISNARFDGTAFSATNGIQAFVTPRTNGNLTFSADWGGHAFLYEIDVYEMDGSGNYTRANQGAATRATDQFAVTPAHPWKIVLQNIEEGFGPTPLEATIGWP
jgi:hypothetical protein